MSLLESLLSNKEAKFYVLQAANPSISADASSFHVSLNCFSKNLPSASDPVRRADAVIKVKEILYDKRSRGKLLSD